MRHIKNTSKLLRRDFYRSFIILLESYYNYHTDAKWFFNFVEEFID